MPFKAVRFHHDPLIPTNDPSQHEGSTFNYININGPCLVRVPSWVVNPLGTYYLYFAHHKGAFIRMAYADNVAGPYTIFDGGVLHLRDSYFKCDGREQRKTESNGTNTGRERGSDQEKDPLFSQVTASYLQVKGANPTACHIASPDVIVDSVNKRLIMTYHGLEGAPMSTSQTSRLAVSSDGLRFTAKPEIAGYTYMRQFRSDVLSPDSFYIAMPGIFYRSRNGTSNFECREINKGHFNQEKWLFDASMRHSAVLAPQGSQKIHIFRTQVGDCPEQILVTEVNLDQDWTKWTRGQTYPLLEPELAWEGVQLPKEPSVRGEIYHMANQLRDPCVFEDNDGRRYLLYTGGGESNIGIVELVYT